MIRFMRAFWQEMAFIYRLKSSLAFMLILIGQVLGYADHDDKFHKTFFNVTEEFSKGKQLAEAYQKPMMLLFVGSDWCPNSQCLLNLVEHDPAFFNEIKRKFVVVKLDFKELARISDPEILEQREALRKKYKVEKFPTIVLIDARGEKSIVMDSIFSDGKTLAKRVVAAYKKIKTP